MSELARFLVIEKSYKSANYGAGVGFTKSYKITFIINMLIDKNCETTYNISTDTSIVLS